VGWRDGDGEGEEGTDWLKSDKGNSCIIIKTKAPIIISEVTYIFLRTLPSFRRMEFSMKPPEQISVVCLGLP
jgi:hypothetical protein